MVRRAVRWLSFAVAIGATATFAASCGGATTYALSVDLRTDLVPGVEFGRVVTEVDDGLTTDHGASEPASASMAPCTTVRPTLKRSSTRTSNAQSVSFRVRRSSR